MRTSHVFRALLLAAALSFSPPALADTPLPAALRSAGVTVQQWQDLQARVDAAATRANASRDALEAVATRLGLRLATRGAVDVADILSQVDDLAQRVATLEATLRTLSGADEPRIRTLIERARTEVDAGNLDAAFATLGEARHLREQINATLQTRLDDGKRSQATLIASQAQVLSFQANWRGAADLYQEATNATPASDVEGRWNYTTQRADMLTLQGRYFSDVEAFRDGIAAYRSALNYAPRETQYERWAITQNALGVALSQFSEQQGGAAAAREAITVLNTLIDSHRGPLNRTIAAAYLNLGSAYDQLGTNSGDEEPLTLALAAYRRSLEYFTERDAPYDWATAQDNMGSALALLGHVRESNLTDSIAAYRNALRVRTPECCALAYAQTQLNMANALGIIGENGDVAALDAAIDALNEASRVYTRERTPEFWGTMQYSAAMTYLALGREGRANVYPLAIDALTKAELVRTRERNPRDWAFLHQTFGEVYREMGRNGEVMYSQRAVEHLQQAESVFTRAAYPQNWAEQEYQSARAYSDMAEANIDGTSERAITSYQNALQVYTPADYPDSYGLAQHNLGVEYERLAHRDPRYLDQAIACYRRALTVRSTTSNPEGFATTQYALGNALRRQVEGGNLSVGRQSIAAYQAALQVYTPQAYEEYWADTKNNLGSAYVALGNEEDIDLIRSGIATYNEVLRVVTRSRDPDQWSMTTLNLGVAQSKLAIAQYNRRMPEAQQSIRASIASLQSVVDLRSARNDAHALARAQFNLAGTYETSVKMGNRDDLPRARALAQEAERTFTRLGDQGYASAAADLLRDLR